MGRWKFCAMAAVLLLAVTAVGAHMGPGRVEVEMVTIHNVSIGSVEIWNTGKRLNGDEDAGSKLIIQLDYIGEPWQIHQVKLYSSPDPVPMANSGKPLFKQFEINGTFDPPLHSKTIRWTWRTTSVSPGATSRASSTSRCNSTSCSSTTTARSPHRKTCGPTPVTTPRCSGTRRTT